MKYFDYLETKFTEANLSMATGNPNDVTVWRQAKVNGALQLVGMSRTVLKYVYILSLIASIVLIKLRLKKAPAFLSSIPQPQPKQAPKLEVVPNEGSAPTGTASQTEGQVSA